MKNIFFIFLLSFSVFLSCSKDAHLDEAVAEQQDVVITEQQDNELIIQLDQMEERLHNSPYGQFVDKGDNSFSLIAAGDTKNINPTIDELEGKSKRKRKLKFNFLRKNMETYDELRISNYADYRWKTKRGLTVIDWNSPTFAEDITKEVFPVIVNNNRKLSRGIYARLWIHLPGRDYWLRGVGSNIPGRSWDYSNPNWRDLIGTEDYPLPDNVDYGILAAFMLRDGLYETSGGAGERLARVPPKGYTKVAYSVLGAKHTENSAPSGWNRTYSALIGEDVKFFYILNKN